MRHSIHLLAVGVVSACLAATIGQATTTDAAEKPGDADYDVVVYGDSSAAVTAAVQAKRMKRSVILVNPTSFPGGMSSSGLGASDFGSRSILRGISAEFYQAIARHYGRKQVRSFEPQVGRRVFEKLIADAGIEVVYDEKLDRERGVKMDRRRIVSITTLSGRTCRGKMFIDATYVGDLMAAAGVTYTVGREAESQYGKSLAGVRRGDTQPRVHYTQDDKDHFLLRNFEAGDLRFPALIERRMVGDYVITQDDCLHKRRPPAPIAKGAIGMDSHVVQYLVNERGHVRRDGTIWQTPPKPYDISYRSIVPRRGECENLLVPSHVAHGSIRMEPVFMALGQAAATAAAVGLDTSTSVQNVDIKELQRLLRGQGP